MITVFADQHLYRIEEMLPSSLDLRLYNPEKGIPSDLDKADALLIRSVTRIDPTSIPDIPENLKFVGTGSAGTDHVDIDYLQRHNICFSSAEGCNARSVAEYVASALLIWAERKSVDLDRHTVGIIGVGNVGSALDKLLSVLGISHLCYDPPRSQREPEFKSASLNDILNCSILTFHVPMNRTGPHATYHWLNEDKIRDQHFQLIINTARGDVTEETALLDGLANKQIGDLITDVWSNEPVFDDRMAERSFIATPHIAGYSKQAKLRATGIVVENMFEFFNLEPDSGCTSPNQKEIPDDMVSPSYSFDKILSILHPILDYHNKLMELRGLEDQKKSTLFNRIRTSFPLRDEFRLLRVSGEILEEYPLLKKLGIQEKQ